VKRSRQLILLGLIMAGLFGTYAYLKHRPAAPTSPAPQPSARPEISLTKLDQAKINKLVFKSAQGSLTLVKQKGVWRSEPAPPYKLNQDQIATAASTFAALNATEIIDRAPRDLGQYGLAPPAATVTVYSAGAAAPLTLQLGDQTPTGYDYYAGRQGNPRVYSISGADGGRFRLSLPDLRNEDPLPRIDPQQCQSFKLIRAGQPPMEITENPQRDKSGADYGMNDWVLVQPYQEPLTVNIDYFSKEVLPVLEGLDREEYIADRPADLARYGLARPRYELIVTDKTGLKLHLLIGKEHNADSLYAKTPDAPAVFTVNRDLQSVLDLKPFQLVNRLAYIINIDQVDKIEVEGGGQKQTFTLTRKIKKARSKKEQDETITTYRQAGKTIKEDVFKTFYRSLIGLAFEGDHPGKLTQENPAVKTTFYLNRGKTRVYRINYVSYNNDFYAVFRNGHSEFLVSKDQVNAMLKDFKALARGKLKARSW
jgi:hypothetical protein